MGSPRERCRSLYVYIYLELKVSDIQTHQQQLQTKLSLSLLLTLLLPFCYHPSNNFIRQLISQTLLGCSILKNLVEAFYTKIYVPLTSVRSKQDKSPHYCERVFRCKRLECQNAHGWPWQHRSDILGWFGGAGWLLRSSRLVWLAGVSAVRLVWLVSWLGKHPGLLPSPYFPAFPSQAINTRKWFVSLSVCICACNTTAFLKGDSISALCVCVCLHVYAAVLVLRPACVLWTGSVGHL